MLIQTYLNNTHLVVVGSTVWVHTQRLAGTYATASASS